MFSDKLFCPDICFAKKHAHCYNFWKTSDLALDLKLDFLFLSLSPVWLY